MDELVKSVVLSKSMLKQPKETIPMAESLLQSEWEPAQSYFTNTEYQPVIKEQQSEEYEENENQFLAEPEIIEKSDPFGKDSQL